MLKNLYINNYKCFSNFKFVVDQDEEYKHTGLFIGKNGSGKTSFAEVLRLFQRIGHGQNNLKPLLQDGVLRIDPLVSPSAFSFGKNDLPMQFEIEVELETGTERVAQNFHYSLELVYPKNFETLRVNYESLKVGNVELFSRREGDIQFTEKQTKPFIYDWHSIYLPSYSDSGSHEASAFLEWLGNMLVLAPIPQRMRALREGKTSGLRMDAANVADWWAGLLEKSPDAYAEVRHDFLITIFPDFKRVTYTTDSLGRLIFAVEFENTSGDRVQLPFDQLSDGEKCLFLAAFVLVANKADALSLCFWDEPDNFLAISEVEFFISLLKRNFTAKGQFLMTSHNPETVVRFPEDNTYLFSRNNHLSPTRPLATVAEWRRSNAFEGDFIEAWRLGDLEA